MDIRHASGQEGRLFEKGSPHVRGNAGPAVWLVRRHPGRTEPESERGPICHRLFLNGVYVDRLDRSARFRWVSSPTGQELT